MKADQSIASMVSMINVSDTHALCIHYSYTGKRRSNIKIWKLFSNVRSSVPFLFVDKSFYY
jgi:hypothetical protein